MISNYDFGFLSILPPIISIILSIVTKEVIFSLFLGLFSGVVIYSFGSGISFLMSLKIIFELISVSLSNNVLVIIFTFILGAFSRILIDSGGASAYAKYFKNKIKSKKASQLVSVGVSFIFSIDDYFNCLTTGTIMRPIVDSHKISRAKLAYILNSLSSPLCVLMPISSWSAAIISCFKNDGINATEIFLKSIIFNFYPIFTIIFLIIIIISSQDFGRMLEFENVASNKKDLTVSKFQDVVKKSQKTGKISDLVIPVMILVIVSILMILETGGFFSNKNLNFIKILESADIPISITIGAVSGLIFAFVFTILNKTLSLSEFMISFIEGAKSMTSSYVLLTLVWSMSSLCKNYLMINQYIESFVRNSRFPIMVFPLIFFVISSFLSFAIGSSWGTFGILLPIMISTLYNHDQNIVVYCAGAVLSGSIFGTHCSPISDNTILSATGAECNHMDHVASQVPYSYFVAIISSVGFLILGFFHSIFLAIFFMIFTLIIGLYFIKLKLKKMTKDIR